jgi:hypothetical protein
MLGPALSAAGLLWMSLLSFGDSYWPNMFAPLAMFGLGIGTTFVPMTLTATAGVPPTQAGLASGLVNTARQIGGAVGLAVLATLAASATRGSRSASRSIQAPLTQAALTQGYDRAFLVAGLLLLIGAGLALLIRSEAPASASGTPGDATRSPATSLTGTHAATSAVMIACRDRCARTSARGADRLRNVT